MLNLLRGTPVFLFLWLSFSNVHRFTIIVGVFSFEGDQMERQYATGIL